MNNMNSIRSLKLSSKRSTKIFLVIICIATLSLPLNANDKIDLRGDWLFRLDSGDVGICEHWFKKNFSETIRLPGSLQNQGYGNEVTAETKWMVAPHHLKIYKDNEKYPSWFLHPMYEKYRQEGNIVFPYWLQPKKHYIGSAWYQRKVEIPKTWENHRIELFLERCHWKTDVWVDDQKADTNDSLVTPQRFDLTRYLRPGIHTLTIRVDNSLIYDIGADSHIIGDHTQSAWNGIIGKIHLKKEPLLWIDDIQVYPDIKNKSANVKVTVGKKTVNDREIKIKLSAEAYNSSKNHAPEPVDMKAVVKGQKSTFEINYPMSDEVQLWDEFNPALYLLNVEIIPNKENDNFKSNKKVSFGMRQIDVNNTVLQINGRDIFLRGEEEHCIFPETGYPPTDIESWRRIMQINKDYGINHLRFHSWCPPEAAFAAADLEGTYIEVSFYWARFEDEPTYQFLLREGRRTLKEYGNHPSFILLSPGQECRMESSDLIEMLQEWKEDNRRLYSGPGNSNWLFKPFVKKEYQYYAARSVNGDQRNRRVRFQSGWPPAPNGSFFTSMAPQTVIDYEQPVKDFGIPIITYEVVQRCSYPDLNYSKKFTDNFKPKYIDIAKDQLKKRGMLSQAQNFAISSGKWQVKQFKAEIEAALRTKGLAGFQLLGIQDYPGHGTALIGFLDYFWDNKGYVTGKQFREFCNTTVPLARMKKMVWKSSEEFRADIEVAHFGEKQLNDIKTVCRIFAKDGEVKDSVEFEKVDIPIGNGFNLGTYQINLKKFSTPQKYCLEVELSPLGFKNSWDFWIYPTSVDIPKAEEILITKQFDEKLFEQLESGRSVLLLPEKEVIAGDMPQCFSSIYWNCPLTHGGESQTMGIICDPQHPVFEFFPTDRYTNWQWYELLVNARPMILDEWNMENCWPKDYYPLIQPINDWHLNRKLAVLTECRVGKGKLVICSMDIETDLENRIVARQMNYSLLKYMQSDAFNPETEITYEQIKSIFK